MLPVGKEKNIPPSAKRNDKTKNGIEFRVRPCYSVVSARVTARKDDMENILQSESFNRRRRRALNLENMIMLDREERILFIGERVFSFLSSKKAIRWDRQRGSLKSVICSCISRSSEKTESMRSSKSKKNARWKKSFPRRKACSWSAVWNEGSFCRLSRAFRGICRSRPSCWIRCTNPTKLSLSEKIGILKVSLNAQSVSFPLVETESMYIIAKEGKIHAFGSSGAREKLGFLTILSERKYPAWLKEGAVLGQKADKVLSDELCKALRECGGEEEKYFTVGAATYIIRKSEKKPAK